MNEIITILRNLIDDNGKRETIVFTFLGNYSFTLIYEIKEVISVKKGNDNLNYTVSGNTITVTDTLNDGDLVEITADTYKYSDEELKAYIKNALNYLSINRYKDFTIDSSEELTPEPTTSEKNLIANIASILILDNYRQKRLPNGLSVTYPVNKDKRTIIERVIDLFKENPDYISNMNMEDNDE